MDDQESVERLDDDPVVRRDRSAGLSVVRVLLDQTLRAGLVDWPRLLKVLRGLCDAFSVEARIDFLPDPSDTLGEAERHGQHLSVPARDHRVRVGHRGHVDHAVLPDLLDLPGTPADDEVQALAGLDHHEFFPEDADLPLRRQIEDRIAAFVANRREVLEVIAAALRGDANLVALLPNDAEVGEELGDLLRRNVLELPVRIRRSDRQEDLRPRGGAPLVQGAADDLVGENVEGEAMDAERLEVVHLSRLDRGEGLDRVVRGHREDEATRGTVQLVTRSPDPLDQGGDLPRRVVLDDLVYGADIDSELQSRC